MSKYGLHGKLQAKQGKGDDLIDILLEGSKLVSSKGCHLYLISKDKNNPDTIWVTEAWDSKEAHDNSLKDDTIRGLISKAIPLLEGMPETGTELEVLGGHGVTF